MKKNARLHATLMAVFLAASACQDVTQPSERSHPEPAVLDRNDLASAAVATLVTVRQGPYQIFIPSATHGQSSGIVMLMRNGATETYRFVRAADGWNLSEHLGTEREPGYAASLSAGGAGPLLARANSFSYRLASTPDLAEIKEEYPDDSFPAWYYMQPVNYTSTSVLRWTQSGTVVTGWDAGSKVFDYVLFKSPPKWVTADSVFAVTTQSKWAFGDFLGQQGECLGGYPNTCYPARPRSGTAWADAYYYISVERRVPSKVQVLYNGASSGLVLSPGDASQLTAHVSDQYGTLNRPVTWTSSNPGVISVSSSGLLTANAFGTVIITATSEGVSGTLSVVSDYKVNVTGPVSSDEGWVTITAEGKPAGSYYYDWSVQWCETQSDGSMSCSPHEPLPSGMNVTSNSEYISRHDEEVWFYVTIRSSSGGSALATGRWRVRGQNEPYPGEGDCGARIC